MSHPSSEPLLTRSFAFLLCANFLLFFAFWSIVPLFPFYMTERFGCSHSTIGVVLALYTLSALCARMFSGFLMDTFSRKPLYVAAYAVFVFAFLGYEVASTLLLLVACRLFHGLSFGMVTVGGNTLVIDITPASRRGEALGYYGLTNNFAMAFGPMVGLFLHDHLSYNAIFAFALLSGALGMLCALGVKSVYKPQVSRPPVSLDRFFMLRGIPAGFALLLLSIPYGMTTNYVALYAGELGLPVNTGWFFSCLALGMAISRMFAGRLVDRGLITSVIQWGFYGVVSGYLLLGSLHWIAPFSSTWATVLFLAVALFLGVGFGSMFPAYNTLFVNLAPHTMRATATSTYLTSWDIGLGAGLLFGGVLSDTYPFHVAYLAGAFLTVVSALFFYFYAAPHFHRTRLR